MDEWERFTGGRRSMKAAGVSRLKGGNLAFGADVYKQLGQPAYVAYYTTAPGRRLGIGAAPADQEGSVKIQQKGHKRVQSYVCSARAVLTFLQVATPEVRHFTPQYEGALVVIDIDQPR